MKEFLQDVVTGLSKDQKSLPSKYIYDKAGSDIFKEIMMLPEYYLTRNEYEILSMQGHKIADALNFPHNINVVELGAGDGYKTMELLKTLQGPYDLTFLPIDVSKSALEDLEKKVKKAKSGFTLRSLVGDYFQVLEEQDLEEPTLFLFLGANIGNYKEKECIELLKNVRSKMKPGDKLLIGFDLKKNPLTIRNAYFDSKGVTKRFNLNVLARINRELGGEFFLDQFDFYCDYNPQNGEVTSYLVSLKDQAVNVAAAQKTFKFKRNELIFTELSKKYSLEDIESLANKAGFKVQENFLDCLHNFTDSLWELK